MLRLIRNIIGTKISRLSVFTHVYTKHSEIASMTRPFPVVGVASKFTNTFRRCSYQSNIAVHIIHIQKVLVALEHTCHNSTFESAFTHHFFGNGCRNFLQFSVTLCTTGIAQGTHNPIGNIFNSIQKTYA